MQERATNFSPLCFVPSWNPHHHCGFHALILFHFIVNAGPIPLGHDTYCLLSISKPLNHGTSPHGLSQVLGTS